MFGVKELIWDYERGAPRGLEAEAVWETPVLQAVCLAHQPDEGAVRQHAAPDADCNCGIHACTSMDGLKRYMCSNMVYWGDRRTFTALVQASGKVVVHEAGWRAETATILAVTAGWNVDILGEQLELRNGFHAAAFLGVPWAEFEEFSDCVPELLPKAHVPSLAEVEQEYADVVAALARGEHRQWIYLMGLSSRLAAARQQAQAEAHPSGGATPCAA
jgi:hypothetical protein